MPFGNRKQYFIGSLSSVLLQLKKYRPFGNLKLKNLSIFQNLKLRILTEKIFPFSLKLNFTPNTLGCYELIDAICSSMTPLCLDSRDKTQEMRNLTFQIQLQS